jgi:hypothetical protein
MVCDECSNTFEVRRLRLSHKAAAEAVPCQGRSNKGKNRSPARQRTMPAQHIALTTRWGRTLRSRRRPSGAPELKRWASRTSPHVMAQNTKDTCGRAGSQPLCPARESSWRWAASQIHIALAGMDHPSFGGWRTTARPRIAWRLPLLVASRIIAASGPRSRRSGRASAPIAPSEGCNQKSTIAPAFVAEEWSPLPS